MTMTKGDNGGSDGEGKDGEKEFFMGCVVGWTEENEGES